MIKFNQLQNLRFLFAFAALQFPIAYANLSVEELKSAMKNKQDISGTAKMICYDGYDFNREKPMAVMLEMSYRPMPNVREVTNSTGAKIVLGTDESAGVVKFKIRSEQADKSVAVLAIDPEELDLNLTYLVVGNEGNNGGRQELLHISEEDCHQSLGYENKTGQINRFNFSNQISQYAETENGMGKCQQLSGKNSNVPRLGVFWDVEFGPTAEDERYDLAIHTDEWGYDYEDLYCQF